MDQSVRERWNDYGIGLLLQGDSEGRRSGVPERDARWIRATPTAG